MRRFKRSARILASLAIVAVLGSVAGPLAVSAGRDFSRCVQQCNEVRKACDGRCREVCLEMFPDDKSARDACTMACKADCLSESDECKDTCLERKNDSPTDP